MGKEVPTMKTLIELDVKDQHLTSKSIPVIASGGQEECELIFTFSSDWEGYERAAVFVRKEKTEKREIAVKVLLDSDKCILPYEIYRSKGSVLVGVFGVLGDTVKTSSCVNLEIARGCATEGSHPSEVTPDIFAQYMERIANDNKDTLEQMNKLMDELISEGIPYERISEAVSDYLEENPEYFPKTAYDYAKDGGYTGTEAEFAAKLAAEYLTSESDPTVPSWAKQTSKPSYTKSEVGLGNVDNIKQYSASNPPPYPVTSVNGQTGAVSVAVPTKLSELANDLDYAQLDDIPKYANETWTFELEDGSTVTKKVVLA